MKTVPRPLWFVLVAVLALLWNLFGLLSFYLHVTATPDVVATWPEAQQQIASVTPRAVRASSVRIQRLIVSDAASGTNFGSEATPFISANRVAFQSLVPKLR